MNKARFYGKPLPGLGDAPLTGTLIVIEGGDGSGRTTQGALLKDWLERLGFPTVQIGLKRSELVGEELELAMQGNELGPRTMALFYATDFIDQLEKVIIPSLRAGFVVLADRYIYTLLARDVVRGADPAWIRDVYSVSVVPDLVLYLSVPPRVLAERSLIKDGDLDFWESGRDIQRSGDIYECFIRYQTQVRAEFRKMEKEFGLRVVDANRDPYRVHAEIQEIVRRILKPRTVSPLAGRPAPVVGNGAKRPKTRPVSRDKRRRPKSPAGGATA